MKTLVLLFTTLSFLSCSQKKYNKNSNPNHEKYSFENVLN